MNTIIIRHTCPHCNSVLYPEGTNLESTTLKDYVFDIVSKLTNISKERIFNGTRKTEVVFARQIIMTVLKRQVGMGPSAIGRLFQKDHATVLAAEKRLQDLCDTEPYTNSTVKFINHLVDVRKEALNNIVP